MESVERAPSTARGIPTEHNNYSGLVQDVVTLSSAVPSSAVGPLRPNISPVPKPWQSLAGNVTDPQATPPVELHVPGLADGEQGVGDESVIAEHRVVVAPHPEIVEPRTKTVGDVLRHAARIIEERGWLQGSVNDLGGRVCAWGGIRVAAYGDEVSIDDDSPLIDLEHGATRALATNLEGRDTILYVGAVANWNDTPGRTAAEVIAALRAAADEADR